MSRISETEFYNDKDVITQIEWLKNNIQADRIDHIQVEQIGDKTSEDYGQTTVKITMENGHEYEGKVTSAILKDVRIQSGEDFNVMVFELANGETISTNIPTGSDSYWALIKGEPQSNTALKSWMDEKAEAVDLTNETNLRVRSDEAIGQRITDLDRDVTGEIERIDGELADKADKSALEEETTKRTEADTGLLQAITDEETARKSADETLETAITGKADQSALETEIAARTDSDTGLLQAITAEETARKSADDGIYGMIVNVNKDLDDETTAREEADALKEDKANKVTTWSATLSDDKYPSEKLVSDSLYTYHNQNITPIAVPPGFQFNRFIEFGNGLTNTIEIVFDKVDSLSTNFKVGHTDYKPASQADTSVRSAFNGEIGGYVDVNGDIWIWSTFGQSITVVLGGMNATYAVKRD